MNLSQQFFVDSNSSEDRDRKFHLNFGKYLSIYTASCPGLLVSSSTPLWEPQISHPCRLYVLHALPMSLVFIPSVKRCSNKSTGYRFCIRHVWTAFILLTAPYNTCDVCSCHGGQSYGYGSSGYYVVQFTTRTQTFRWNLMSPSSG